MTQAVKNMLAGDHTGIFKAGDIVIQNDNPRQWLRLKDVKYIPDYDYTDGNFDFITRDGSCDRRGDAHGRLGYTGAIYPDRYSVIETERRVRLMETEKGPLNTRPEEGWDKPGLSRKWHYFRGLRSLCGHWMLGNTGDRELGNDDHADNCTACRKALKREQEKEAGA